MTPDEQIKMFDCTTDELDAALANAQRYDPDIVRIVMSMLSDVQEMIACGFEEETIRRTLNRAKYYLDKSRTNERRA